MMNIGDKVTYKAAGVCAIEEISNMMLPGEKTASACYVLRPISDPAVKIFVPTGNEALLSFLRPVLSADEMLALFDAAPQMTLPWNEDMRARANDFRALLARGEREEVAAMIKTIMTKREALTKEGRKLYASDETLLKKAEKMLFDEAAYVLEMSYEDVAGLFAAKLSIYKEEKV